MWFMNKIANPLVRWILRSPLQRLMSTTLLLITYRGRKSGKDFTLPVQYVQEGGVIYIVPGAAEKKTWWRNLRGGAPVRLLLKGQSVAGNATLLEGPADCERIVPALNIYLQGFPAAAKMRKIRLDDSGSFNQDDLRQAARSAVMVCVDSGK